MPIDRITKTRSLRVFGAVPSNSLGEGSTILAGGVSIDGNMNMRGGMNIEGSLIVNGKDIGDCQPGIIDLGHVDTTLAPNRTNLDVGTPATPWRSLHVENIGGHTTIKEECQFIPFELAFRNILVTGNFNEADISLIDCTSCVTETEKQGIYIEMSAWPDIQDQTLEIEISGATHAILNGHKFAKRVVVDDEAYGYLLYVRLRLRETGTVIMNDIGCMKG